MKKTSIILTLAAMLVAMVSCTKEEQPVSGKFTMTVNADKGSRATKDLFLDGSTLNATWKAGEEVKVYKGETLLGTLTAASDGSTTTLSGTIEGTIAERDELTLKFLSNDYDGQDGTLEYIAEHCDYAVATVTISGISGSSVSTTDAVFENQQAIVKFTLKQSDGSDLPSNPTALTINYAYGTGSVTLSSIPAATYTTNEGNGVLYVAIPGFEDETVVTLTATVGDDTYAKTVSGITFANGQYYTVTAGLKKLSIVTWTSSDIRGINLIYSESPSTTTTTIKGITASTDRSTTWNGSTIESPRQEGLLIFSSSTYTFYKIEITCSQPSNTLAGWSYSDGKLVWNGTPATRVRMMPISNPISNITQIDFTVQ